MDFGNEIKAMSQQLAKEKTMRANSPPMEIEFHRG
jgi:hypothetical protein